MSVFYHFFPKRCNNEENLGEKYFCEIYGISNYLDFLEVVYNV